ncbi:carbamoyltransferase [Simiduia agarivorans]|uniref:Carbamoyltransferase n=1 Tax=Simiduia agarivorans (strain DSM 21679 / JCM 13881 / BCRC 17597 / SA1) TaxID=1117647 RepID=K4KL68_SIMAS|nr:carbamoyltransferase C-terminal domain-containing protein [Simiduia agarivorans]AFU98975.1 carbamoyltransferase [Simiduia agarivorans SA1 = DSM 21679]
MNILGINYIFHDTSSCIVQDGDLICALEEERFTRNKHTYEFPERSIQRCLSIAKLDTENIDHIAVSIDPWKHQLKKIAYALSLGFKSKQFIKNEFWRYRNQQQKFWHWYRHTWPGNKHPEVHFIEHHKSHILGSYFVSPYENAALLSLDGSGEWSTHWMGEIRDGKISKIAESFFPNSLGSFYEAATEFCGFRPNYDEGKTMGLAPFGNADRLYDKARSLVTIKDTGEIAVDTGYFNFPHYGECRYNEKFVALFGKPRAQSKTAPFESHHEDVAAAFQKALEDCALKMCKILEQKTSAEHIIIAGGVALNSVMNGRIIRETRFKDAYIMPAAGDNGTAIGAAYCVWNDVLGNTKRHTHLNPFVGTSYSDDEVEATLKGFKLSYKKCDDICQAAAQLIHQGKIIGWFQGNMEIGPRALGSRSIVADPTNANMKGKINAEVKYREPYRPFAPSAIEESYKTYFELGVDDPFMLKVDFVKPEWRAKLAAITHVDGSARLQTVSKKTNPLYHRLISEVGKLTGTDVVLNTSFNVMGEPVVESPEQAIRCFYTSGLDALAIGNFLIMK